MAESPHAVDMAVGQAVRRHRKAAGWSQERLAEALGITFQQLQKYEKAANRISASKLLGISQALGVPVAAVFDEEPELQTEPFDRQLAAQVAALSPEGRAAVRTVVAALREGATPLHRESA